MRKILSFFTRPIASLGDQDPRPARVPRPDAAHVVAIAAAASSSATLRPPSDSESTMTDILSSSSSTTSSQPTRQPLRAVVADCTRRWSLDSRESAEEGDLEAMVLVGQMYLSGWGALVREPLRSPF